MCLTAWPLPEIKVIRARTLITQLYPKVNRIEKLTTRQSPRNRNYNVKTMGTAIVRANNDEIFISQWQARLAPRFPKLKPG
jgi:hypothetical protein